MLKTQKIPDIKKKKKKKNHKFFIKFTQFSVLFNKS